MVSPTVVKTTERRRVSERTLLWAGFFVLVGLTALTTIAAVPVGTVEVDWQAPGNEDVLAPQAGKPILYFFTADWCAPCHQMKRRVFRKPEYIEKVERWYYPVEVKDVSRERGANLPEVNDVLRNYKVRTLPTLVVALPDGTEVARQTGFGGVSRLSTWLETQYAEATSRMAQSEAGSESKQASTAPDS